MRLGPDGKIYFGSGNEYGYGYFQLGRINYPDSVGFSCALQDSVPGTVFSTVLQDTLLLGQCFPNEVVQPGTGLNPLTLVFNADTLRVFPDNYPDYQWYNNSAPITGATGSYLAVSANGWYSVKAGNGGNCTGSAFYEVTGITDTGTVIHDAALSDNLNVYPNPATDYIYVQAPLKFNLSLYNTQGKKCLQSNGTNTLSTAGLIKGLYFLVIHDPKGNLMAKEKIVVQRP